MTSLVTLENVEKQFTIPNQPTYIALKGIDLEIREGEFVSLIGHSGCGKSTLLNMVAGLSLATGGIVALDGQTITAPGPDRMVVFQNYSLLPWLTVRQNVALAVDAVLKNTNSAERSAIIETHIDLVGLRSAVDKLPHQLSGGMKQRVAIARALALKPKLLLLDEPFGALDALTRGNLQEQLMHICETNAITAVMVTHDVDEAVLLSDRVVMLTNGPEARIGQIVTVDIPRPRQRLAVVNHPSYYSYRSEVIYFLAQQKRLKSLRSRKHSVVAQHGLEKVNLDIGFVPLTACAPLVIAQEKGFFKKHGLDDVHLVRESNWRGIADGIRDGWLDAAQMPAAMPAWLALGGAGQPIPITTALTLTRNGNGITLAQRLYEHKVYSLNDLRTYLLDGSAQQHRFGVVHPSSMHSLLLHYWLATGGINPLTDIDLKIIPPAQMVASLRNGTIDGYCVGDPWNVRAAHEGLGYTIATDLEIWPGHPGKVLGVRETWASRYPNTHIALVKALLEACRYCADSTNHAEIVELLSQRQYLGMPKAYIQLADPNANACQLTQPEGAHHQFFMGAGNRPSRSEHVWMMTQLARWGVVPFPRNWVEIVERVCQVGVFGTAARELDIEVNYQRAPILLFDGQPFNAEDPLGYLREVSIKHDVYVADVSLARGA